MSERTTDRPNNKVARLIEENDLHGVGETMESKWVGDDGERESLRDLADFFNELLLEQAVTDAGGSTLEIDVTAMYQTLTDEERSSGVRTKARKRLERMGVAVEQLETDFVTYQAIRSYLKEWRGVEYERPSDETKLRKDIESIQRLESRLDAVTTDRIEKLRETGRLDIAEFDVLLDVTVICRECDSQYEASTLIEQGGCDCFRES